MTELRISVEKVCALIESARELAGKVPPTTGDNTTTGDDSELIVIEETADDPTREQMDEFIAGLNIEEQVDLLALIYVGRGDFALEEWDDAVEEARDRIDAGDPDFMVGSLTLPGYLEEGLDAFGRSCDDES